MPKEQVERRLAAILAADVAGYSRLMGADEEGTLAALQSHRRECLDFKIAEHRGRIVKTTGDGLLIEFASIVDATRCALAIQRGVRERNASAPHDKRLEFRIGINVGDVILQDGDIFGDGVNIASRLEGMADAGGIVISAIAHDAVINRVDAEFRDLGELLLKNIERPVRAFQVLFESGDRANAARAVQAIARRSGAPERPTIAVRPFMVPRLPTIQAVPRSWAMRVARYAIWAISSGTEILRQAFEMDPSNAQAEVALGAALTTLGDLDAGIARLRHGIKLSPRDRRLAFWGWLLGAVLLRASRPGEALEEARTAARRDPRFHLPLILEAVAQEGLGQTVLARAALMSARRIRPNLRCKKSKCLMARTRLELSKAYGTPIEQKLSKGSD